MDVLKLLWGNLRKGPATEAFPFGPAPTPERYRGRVTMDVGICVGCKTCEHVCAGGAIRFRENAEGLQFLIWHNTCVSCGLCEVYCPTKAIHLTTDWHTAHLQEDKYRQVGRATIPFAVCAACATRYLRAGDALMQIAYRGVGPNEQRLRDLCPDCRRVASAQGARA